jgi:hypothetical protein
MVNVAAFYAIICDKSTLQYTLRVSPSNETLSFASLAEVDFADLSGILAEYHDFIDIFSESEAYNLLPYREFNLKIETVDGAEPPVSPIYSLSPMKR